MSQFKLCIFASGRGSNAEKIIEYFGTSSQITIDLIVTNKKTAKVLDLALQHQISQYVIGGKETFLNTDGLLSTLRDKGITHIILAGFLWLIPKYLIEAFPDKIINIHPALLPKYGGIGMYGMNVHKAVKENKETESGITIHLVNEKYDEGKQLRQASCAIAPTDSADQIAQKVLALEHHHYPRAIEEYLLSK